jgi:hypothetical protein
LLSPKQLIHFDCGDVDGEVGAVVPVVGWDVESDGFLALEIVAETLLAFPDGVPGGEGIADMEEPGLEDEVFVLAERHLGVLRRREGRVLGADPAELALGFTLHEPFHEGFAGLLQEGDACGVVGGEDLGVLFGPEGDGDVDLLHHVELDGIGRGEEFVGRVGQRALLQRLGAGPVEGKAAGLVDGFEDSLDAGHGRGFGGDGDQIARSDAGGETDEEIGQGGQSWIAHGGW